MIHEPMDAQLAQRVSARREFIEETDRFIADVSQMEVQRTPGKGKSKNVQLRQGSA